MQKNAIRRAGLAVAVLACAALAGGSLSGFANPDAGKAGAAGAVAAAERLAPSTVANIADASSNGADAALFSPGGAEISVPVSATRGIQIDAPTGIATGSVTIGLPFSDTASSAAVTKKKGVVVYDNNNGSSTVPVVHENGSLQVTTILEDASAPTRYDYPFSLGSGQSLTLTADGGASITDANGNTVATIEAPWAKDSNGDTVATNYEIHGKTLTQVVHTTASTAFPVVADPTYWWGGKTWLKQSDVSVPKVVALVASAVGAGLAGLVTAGMLELCDSAGKGIWVYWTWAGQVWCTGP